MASAKNLLWRGEKNRARIICLEAAEIPNH